MENALRASNPSVYKTVPASLLQPKVSWDELQNQNLDLYGFVILKNWNSFLYVLTAKFNQLLAIKNSQTCKILIKCSNTLSF